MKTYKTHAKREDTQKEVGKERIKLPRVMGGQEKTLRRGKRVAPHLQICLPTNGGRCDALGRVLPVEVQLGEAKLPAREAKRPRSGRFNGVGPAQGWAGRVGFAPASTNLPRVLLPSALAPPDSGRGTVQRELSGAMEGRNMNSTRAKKCSQGRHE